MIEYARLVHGAIEAVPNANQGMPVVETPPPDSLEYGYKAVAHYEQQGHSIVKVWEIQPWTEQDWQDAREAEVQVKDAESSSEVGSET